MSSAGPALTVVVAEDEPSARSALLQMLAGHAGLEVVATATDGVETVAKVREHRPDALFLDVRMPRRSGLSALAEIPEDRRPLVVFVTAYSEHAVEAFELAAVDYLVKPIGETRLAVAIDRLLERLAAHAEPGLVERIKIRDGARTLLLDPRRIEWVEAADYCVRIHRTDGSHDLVRDTLVRLEATLGTGRFVRVHRSALVAITAVRAVVPLGNGEAAVELDSGRRVRVSRHRRREVEAKLGL